MSSLKSLSLLVVSLVFIACSGQPERSGPPQWIHEQPMDATHIYGVGSAPYNIGGFTAQKKAAMAQAIDVISRQKRIKVKAELERLKLTDQGSTSVDKAMSHSIQTVEDVVVNAKVKAEYHDRYRDIYYVLMVE